ncbi:MAG: hypothetical protein H0X26_10335 [Alphaproteobacteria bacterium]|nr:hypothetical protein [Alphaproteobacteria bacterium]
MDLTSWVTTWLIKKFYRSYKTIRRFLTRSSALYEPLQGNRNVSRRYKRNPHDRDMSEYQVNEPAPTDAYFKNILTHLLSLAAQRLDTLATLRRYIGQWARLARD